MKEPTVYLSPEKVSCPTCGAKPNTPCTRVSGSAIEHYHWTREHWNGLLAEERSSPSRHREPEGRVMNDETSRRTGSVIARGQARPAWRTTSTRGGVMYDRGDGTLVSAGPAVEDTYAMRSSVTDQERNLPDHEEN